MSAVVSLSCPNCGGKLQITPDIEKFACAYCGRELVVNRGEGIVSIKPVLEKIAAVSKSLDQVKTTGEQTALEVELLKVELEKEKTLAWAEKRKQEITHDKEGNSPSARVFTLCLVSVIAYVLLTMFTQKFGASDSDVVPYFIGFGVLGLLIFIPLLKLWQDQSESLQSQEDEVNRKIEDVQTQEEIIRNKMRNALPRE